MPDTSESRRIDTERAESVSPPKIAFDRTDEDRTHKTRGRFSRVVLSAAWLALSAISLLAALALSTRPAEGDPGRLLLPVEILGSDGTTVTRSVTIQAGRAASVQALWLQVNGLRYPGQASVQINRSAWFPLNDQTVTIAEPARSFGGIGGFATLAMSLVLPKGTVVDGKNTIRFRFNGTDGVSNGYRVLAFNLLTGEEKKIIPPEEFAEDSPDTWTPPLSDAASIQAGRELWHSAPLVASSLPNAKMIQARCADCHTQDGRDLKYFSFSNSSIIARSTFHGLSRLQGEQIASYIRNLPVPNPGRPWNPPYQPGPGLDEQPVSSWAAGAGINWVLERDIDAFPYLLRQSRAPNSQGAADSHEKPSDPSELANQITPYLFQPDGNLDPRQIPIAFELPDWSQWLPRVHPKDAWGPSFTRSSLAAFYGDDTNPESEGKIGKKSLRALLAASQTKDRNLSGIRAAFVQWSASRRAFLAAVSKPGTIWSPELTDKIYSTQQWQLVKTWEMMQEFDLEGRGRDIVGPSADARIWCSTIPAETAPSESQIPDGPAGVGGSAVTNEYFTAAWYQLQILLNSGNHRHRDRGPVDWVYVIGRFPDLYAQTHRPEPVRLLVAITKALQSTDPHLGPDNLSEGWRPDENVDPRILINPVWTPIFEPLPIEARQAITQSLLEAWMDKNLQYPIAEYLPLGLLPRAYTPTRPYGKITGGKVWEAAQQFRDAGAPADLVERLQQWGTEFNDRASRIDYR